MGTKYSTVTLSAYNNAPPPDDGSQAASNLVTWSGIKTKIGDPLKTQVAAIDAALVAALNTSCRAISSNDNVLAADHWKTLEVSNGATITLMDAATAAAGFTVKIVNVGSTVVKVTRTTAGDFINGVAVDVNLKAGDSATVTVNAAANGYVLDYGPVSPPRSYLSGLTLSTAGSSTTMTTAAGQATDSTNAVNMNLASSVGKTTSAWAVGTGNGGLDTGAIANSTWYHFYLIMRTDTDTVDVLFSLSASSPTMPSGYSYSRRIGSGKTNGSGQWTSFVQYGDLFSWATISGDVNAGNPGTSAVTRTLNVPTGVSVQAQIQVMLSNSASAVTVFSYFSDLATTDSTPSNTISDLPETAAASGTSRFSAGRLSIQTNTSGQIRSRLSNSDANTTLLMNTIGWIDRRGRDS